MIASWWDAISIASWWDVVLIASWWDVVLIASWWDVLRNKVSWGILRVAAMSHDLHGRELGRKMMFFSRVVNPAVSINKPSTSEDLQPLQEKVLMFECAQKHWMPSSTI